MFARGILIGVGAFQIANGLYMLAAPASWYEAVPGVVDTGPMNGHFIADIGLAYVASGVLLVAGARAGRAFPYLAVAGALWPAMHALLHLWGWVAHGLPNEPAMLASDALAVMAPSGLALIIAWRLLRAEGSK